MGVVGGGLGYWLLRSVFPRTDQPSAVQDRHRSLATRFGETIWNEVSCKTVIDFGCGSGEDALDIARYAKRVIGIDIQEDQLEVARQSARQQGITNATFASGASECADVIISVNSFEHFADPMGVLRTMKSLLTPAGKILISFGPTWYHPYGGHLFSTFPWGHLVFTEKALIRWRSDFKNDAATKFGEVAGGLNQMTIARFERMLHKSGLVCLSFETVPINVARMFHNRITREALTSFIRCSLALQ